MDFMHLIKGIEALLYECLSWVIFYPLTMVRVIVHPIAMMRYAETELVDKPSAQFDDSMSPPIFMVVTLVLSSLLQRGLGVDSSMLPAAMADTNNLVMFRAIALGLFPLMLAMQSVRQRKVRLTRQSMQPAFYGQCLVAGPVIAASGLVLVLSGQGEIERWIALALGAVALGWYVVVQTRWLRLVGAGWVRATVTAVLTILLTFVLLTAFSALITNAAGAL